MASRWWNLLRDSEQRRVPVVVTPYADDRADEAISGASGSLLIPRRFERLIRFRTLCALAKRKISNLARRRPGTTKSQAALLAERARRRSSSLRPRRPFCANGSASPARPFWPPPFVPLVAARRRDIGSLVGSDEFVLCTLPSSRAAIRSLRRLLRSGSACRSYCSGRWRTSSSSATSTRSRAPWSSSFATSALARLRSPASTPERGSLPTSRGLRAGLHRLARGAAFGAAVVAPARRLCVRGCGRPASDAAWWTRATSTRSSRAFRTAWERSR